MAWIEAVDKECYNLRELTSMRVEVTQIGSAVAVVTDMSGHYGPVKLAALEFEENEGDYYIVGDESPLRPYTMQDLRDIMQRIMYGIASLAEGNMLLKQKDIDNMVQREIH